MEKLACPSGLQIAFVLVILTIPSSPQALGDKCLARCESVRPVGLREAYKFQCNDDAYVTRGSEKVHCREDCDNACAHICTKKSIDNFDDFDYTYEFSCPSTDISDADCKDRCDSNRPLGSTDGYTLNCDVVFGYGCYSGCKSCPRWVCDPEKDDKLYHCPTLPTTCSDQCDNIRKYKPDVGREAFSFYCSNEYAMTYQERELCKQNCGDCPLSICNPYENDNFYNCPAHPSVAPSPTPTREYDGKCKERCNKFSNADFQPSRLGGHEAYSFKCQDVFDEPEDRDACYDDCDLCPENVCKLSGLETLGQFNCPEDSYYKKRREEEMEQEERDDRAREEELQETQGYLIATIFGVLAFLLCSALAVWGVRKNRSKTAAMQQQGNQGMQQGQYGYGMPFAGQSQVSPGPGLPLQSPPGGSYVSAPPGPMNSNVAPNLHSPGIPPNQQFGTVNKGVS